MLKAGFEPTIAASTQHILMEKQSTPQCAIRPHFNHKNAVHACAIHPLICPTILILSDQLVYSPIHRGFHSSFLPFSGRSFFLSPPFLPSFLLSFPISFISLFLSFLSNDAVSCLDYTASIDEWVWSNGGMTLTGGKPTVAKETSPCATLHIIHSTCTDTWSNPGLLVERPATNRLSQGTANCPAVCHSLLHPTTHTFAHPSPPSVRAQPPAISRPNLNTMFT